jgi:Tol biopolymer transport system component
MFCTACAAANRIASPRCAACGASLAPAGPTSAVAGRGPRQRRLRRVGWVRTALIIFLPVVLVAAGGGYWQADRGARAAAYARGDAALSGGRYVEAIDAFAAAGSFRDAEARRADAEAALAPYERAYFDAVAALATEDYETAVALLVPVARDLPDFRDAAALLAEARRRREQELYRTIDAAEERRDWLTVERALAELAAANPEDPELQARLEEVRRDHSPLVYSRGRALFLIGPDGSDERLVIDDVAAVWPVWSPDRSRIAFVSPDRTDYASHLALYVVEADGSAPRRLAESLRPYAAPVWSPDGKWIAYASQARAAGSTEPSTLSVRIVEVATEREIDLTAGWLPNAAAPSWSPDGRRLAVVSRRDEGLHEGSLLPTNEVYVVTIATGEVTNLGQGRIRDPWRVAWSPAAEALLVSTRQTGMSYDADRAPLYLLDTATGALKNLNPRLAKVSMPVWSPDGRRFAYVEGELTIRVHEPDGREAGWTKLDEPVIGTLTWSPGGDALLAAGGPGQVCYLIPLGEDFGQERPVTLGLDVDGRQSGPPQWSPVNPVAAPDAATTAGTAHDPAVAPDAGGTGAEHPVGAR